MIFSRTKGACSGILFARWFRTKTRGSASLLAQKGRGSRQSRRMPTSPWATPSSSPAGLRATPSPRSSGCGTSECFWAGCWALGPRRWAGCWVLGPRRWAGCWALGPRCRAGCWALGPSRQGCWALGPSHPSAPEAPGCLPTLTFPAPPLEGTQRLWRLKCSVPRGQGPWAGTRHLRRTGVSCALGA